MLNTEKFAGHVPPNTVVMEALYGAKLKLVQFPPNSEDPVTNCPQGPVELTALPEHRS